MKTIILNHKSHLDYDEIIKYRDELPNFAKDKINLILFPNITYLSLFKHSNIKLGTQNFYSYNSGSYTGEASLELLKSINVTYTLVGHPERLLLKIDSYNQVKDKFLKSINSGFKTILCIGHDEKMKILKQELKFFLKGLDHTVIKNLIIAFEPASKIEDGIANIREIEFVRNFIKEYIQKYFEEDVPFFYGGSVNKNNIKEILKITDGVILGKISTNVEEIKNILKEVNTEENNKDC